MPEFKVRILANIAESGVQRMRRILFAIRRYGRPSPGRSVGIKILQAARSIGVLTIGVKLVSLCSTIVVASFFGTGDDREAFLIAFLLPSMSITVICGAFNSAMIPTYIRIQRQYGSVDAQALFSRVMFLAIGLLVFVAVCLAILLPFILPMLASGFDQSKQMLATTLAYLLLPAVVIKGIGTIYGAVLNAHERFALVAAAPVMVPLSMVAILLLWSAPSTRVYAMAVGTVVGMFAELVALGWALKSRGIALFPRWRNRGPGIRRIAAQYLPMVAGALMMSATDLVDRTMAASLSSGSLASLDYGGRLVIVILGVVSGAIGTAVLPYFSRLVDERNWKELRSLLRVFGAWILAVTTVVTVLLVVLSETLIGVGLQRGAFTHGDTELVARIQAVYAVQIPFYACGMMFVRAIASLTAGHVLAIGSFLNLVLNVVLNYVFMRQWGVAGIALSTACVYLFSCAFVMTMTYRTLYQRQCGASKITRNDL